MMRKHLLLITLLINIVAVAVSQVDKTNKSLTQMDTKNNTVVSWLRPAHRAASLIFTGASSISIYALDQPVNQISEGTPTPTITQQPEKKNAAPTRTPRPTTTPVPIPPAANPNATSLMILFGLIAVIVVIVGVWLNRSDK
jgi:hypothetical protein